MINFASDNAAPVHPKIFEMMQQVNKGMASSYGNDPYTKQAEQMFKELFNKDVSVFFVFNGTGANTIALDAMTQPYNSILTVPSSHITEDECGAPTRFTGCVVKFVTSKAEKIRTADLVKPMDDIGNEHRSQPKVVSISQVTEMGEVYSPKELSSIVQFCAKNNLYVHMDGARISNAAVSVDSLNPVKGLRSCTDGVDILTFGGTKNGALGAEAIIVDNKNGNNADLSDRIKFVRKQGMQLASKMRYISAQFVGLLTDNLWAEMAYNSNSMLSRLHSGIKSVKSIEIVNSPDANIIFAYIDKKNVEELLKTFYFYPIRTEGDRVFVRLMTSWNTTNDDVDRLVDAINRQDV